ncbi:MAG: hypothetical protein IPN85_02340 [Flavobacteriales bacterium]|nr:hypothetical protein [Flavobacteriales bacterium]
MGRELIQVGMVAMLFYASLACALDYPVTEAFMFFSADARDYREVGDWLLHGTATDATLLRPYLYPVVRAVASALGGAVGVWAMQAMAWLVCVICVHLAVLTVTGRRWLAWVVSTMLMLNLSLFALTYHALTEVFTAMLLSVLMLFLAGNIDRWARPRFFCSIVLQLALLSLVRPVFFPLLLVWLFVCGPLLYYQAFKATPKALFLLVLTLLPVVPQLVIMRTKHDHLGISTVGESAFRNYLFAEGYGKVNGLSFSNARVAVQDLSGSEMRRFLGEHARTFIGLYGTHLERNIYRPDGVSLELVPKYEHPRARLFMMRTNKVYTVLHVLAFLPCSWLFIMMIRRGDKGHAVLWGMAMVVTWFILLTCGISFWQRDRLVVPVVPVFLILYMITVDALLPFRRSMIKAEGSGTP